MTSPVFADPTFTVSSSKNMLQAQEAAMYRDVVRAAKAGALQLLLFVPTARSLASSRSQPALAAYRTCMLGFVVALVAFPLYGVAILFWGNVMLLFWLLVRSLAGWRFGLLVFESAAGTHSRRQEHVQ
jgi:hypothetical protein